MTTTSHFQINPDFYSSVEKCDEKNYVNTNPRYKFFSQTHFTAGDAEQFETYRDQTNGNLFFENINLENNVYTESVFQEHKWIKYQNLDALSVKNTFNYLFNKFKKAIFIKIKKGNLKVFLPFSKKNFTNEWKEYIKIDPKFGNMDKFFEYIQKMEGRKFYPDYINRFVENWYANNCLVRWEFPINEGDTNVQSLKDMMLTLCKEREIPDFEFFVNKRDFPLLKRNETEAYNHIFGNNKELLSHNYKNYSPILSMVGSEEYADIPIPTGEDWARVCREEGKFFPKTEKRDYKIEPVLWEKRKPTAVFRGSSTGSGVTIDTNPRLKVAYLSRNTPKDKDGFPFLDAGITDWNTRPRKIEGEKYLKTIDKDNLPFCLVNKLSPQKQTEYKYVINIDGHVCAYRLSLEMFFGSCILLVDSKYKLWFKYLMKPYVHYIPIKSDLSDLIEKIVWCKQNDNECKKIADNSVIFAKKYLSKNGILDYMQKLLFELKQYCGIYIYNDISILDLQLEKEKELLKTKSIQHENKKLITFPKGERNYSILKAMEWIILKYLKEDNNEIFKEKETIFTNNSTTITKYKIGNTFFIEKESKKGIIHEAFISKETNELIKKIPNFSYIFTQKKNKIYSEFIEGNTLLDFIHKDFNMDIFIKILFQIGLCLHVAQKKCAFVHHDLTPWNIIIQKIKTKYFDYAIDCENVCRIKTELIPIIFDMGRAHVVHNNEHYGKIDIFSVSTIKDILVLLSNSLYEISRLENISREDVKKILILSNFFANTQFRGKNFVESGKNGLGDVKYFFGKVKKFNELVFSDKKDLEKKTPLDFINYLMKNFELSSFYYFDNSIKNEFVIGNAKQIFDFCFSGNEEESVLKFFERIENHKIPQMSSLYLCYLKMNMLEYLENVYKNCQKTEKIEEKYKSIKNKIEKDFLVEITLKKLKKEEDIFYDETIFFFPEKVLENITKKVNVENYSDILEELLLKNFIPKEYKKYYVKNNFNYASLNSLKNISSKIYEINLRNIKSQKYDDSLEKYIQNIECVLKLFHS